MAGLMLVVATLSGCGNPSYTWHQKMTVTVSTPNGVKTGAAVSEVTASVGRQGFLSEAIVAYTVKGEATVIDLGNGKYLFALLSSSGNPTEYWAMRIFYRRVMDQYPGSEDELNRFYSALVNMRDAAPFAADRYPLLITFADINDPKTAREVKPDNLAAAFGSGYALRSITLEITDDPVTDGEVQSVVHWIGDPNVMENPGWKNLPVFARQAIGGLLTDFKKAQTR